MKVAVAIPSHDNVPFLFAYDLASLIAYTVATLPDDVEFGVLAVSGTYVHAARQELAEAVLKDGVDWVLWLDADMRFPRDAFVRLMQHRVPFVGINYSQRGLPPDYVAIKRAYADDAGEPSKKLVTTSESTGLEEVDAIGFGVTLMHRSVLESLPPVKELGQPWFFFEWMPEIQQQRGEDVRFCRLVREAGGKVLVDHDLSLDCAHIGQFEYRLQHIEGWRE